MKLFEAILYGTTSKDDDEHLIQLRTKFLQNLDSKFISSQHILASIKQTKCDAEIIRLFEPCFEWTNVEQEIIQRFNKSATISTEFREKGNYEYKLGNLVKALRAYNLAITFARPGQAELGLAFGNRSAVFVAMNLPWLVLQDIQYALQNQIPSHLHEKLEQRRNKCLDLIKREKAEKNETDSVTSNSSSIKEHLFTLKCPNEQMVCVENFVHLSYDEVCGRKLVVTKDVAAGTILSVEQPYVTVLEKELEWDLEHCHYCFKRILGGVPCTFCTFAMFCNGNCLTEAMSTCHQYDHHTFSYFHSHEALHNSDLMSLRIITKTGFNYLYNQFSQQQQLNGNKSNENHTNSPESASASASASKLGYNSQGIYESSYHQIYHLISHSSLDEGEGGEAEQLDAFISNIFKAFTLCNLLHQVTNFFNQVQVEKQNEFKNFITCCIFHHLEAIKYNAVAFSELLHLPVTNSSSSTGTISNPFAVGLFPTLSLANHSCSPNSVHVRNIAHCSTSLITIKPLQPGQEITITYGPKFQVKSTIERQLELQRKYKFRCNCEACHASHAWGPSSITTNIDDGINLEYITSICPTCAATTKKDTKQRLNCANCLAKVLALNSQIDTNEQKLRKCYDVILSLEKTLFSSSNNCNYYCDNNINNVNNDSSLNYNFWGTIQDLKPCLQFFGSYFKPTFNLTQIGQDLFKKILVYYPLSQMKKY